MLAATDLGDKHGRRHDSDAAEYKPFLVTELGRVHASRLAGRERLRQGHPGNGKSDSGNNRAGFKSFTHDPSDFGFFPAYTLLGSAARGKRENLTICRFCLPARLQRRLPVRA
jgi:hypothetical protein